MSSYTLAEIAAECEIDTAAPGFVKMDIEGAERFVFDDEDSRSFLAGCRGVSIEVHMEGPGGSALPLCEAIETQLGRSHLVTTPYRKARGCLLYAIRKDGVASNAHQ